MRETPGCGIDDGAGRGENSGGRLVSEKPAGQISLGKTNTLHVSKG